MNREHWENHKRQNILQSVLLIVTLTALVAYLGLILAGSWLAWAAVIVIILAYFFNPLLSPHVVLKLYRGRVLRADEAPQLYRIVNILSQRAGLSKPPVLYYLPSNIMNAFATGHSKNAVIGLSDGILRRLNLQELTAVLAHEISHIRHGDIRVMAYADFTARLTHILSLTGQVLILLSLPFFFLGYFSFNWFPLLVLIFAPIISALLQLALSRTREFDADLGAVELLGNAQYLVQALSKLEHYQGNWIKRIFFPQGYHAEPSLLRTHPPTQERINRLMDLIDLPKIPMKNVDLLHDILLPTRLLAKSPIRPSNNYIMGIWF